MALASVTERILKRLASSDAQPRPLTADDVHRILRDAERLQDNWGTDYEYDRHQGPAPALDVILRDEVLPTLHLVPADADRLVEAARQEQARRDQRRRQAALRELHAAVGRRFAEASLDNYEATSAEQKKVLEAVKGYAANIGQHVADGAGLVAFGAAGTGKTHLLAAVAKVAVEADLTIHWINGQDLFARFRAAIDGSESEAKIVQGFVSPDVLVVDDVLPPSGALTEYQASTLYRIVDARYRACSPTWATLNVANGAEAERGMSAQVVDRLRHGSLCVFCDWPSHRKAQA